MNKEDFLKLIDEAKGAELTNLISITLMIAILDIVNQWRSDKKTSVECMIKLSELSSLIEDFATEAK
jgi:hypothetical protein